MPLEDIMTAALDNVITSEHVHYTTIVLNKMLTNGFNTFSYFI